MPVADGFIMKKCKILQGDPVHVFVVVVASKDMKTFSFAPLYS